jgi:hypothetical protein
MSFRYDNFLSFVKEDGLAKQNRFEVDIAMPPALVARGYNNRNLTLLTKSVSVPGVNIATGEIRVVGEIMPFPYDRTFGGATVTFYVDKRFNVRKIFEDWVDAIQDPNTRLLGWYNDTISDIKVLVMDKQENINFEIQLFEVRPKTLGALSLDQGTGEMMTFDVTFDFKYYRTYYSNQPSNETVSVTDSLDTNEVLLDSGLLED